jgi:hypothetical protein
VLGAILMADEPTETERQQSKTEPEQWRPSFGDLVTVLALVAAIVMWFAPPNWEIGIPVVVASIALVAITARRHTSHPLIRSAAAIVVVTLLIAVAWRPIWDSFHKDYPHVAFRSPVTFGESEPRSATASEPPDMPPLNLPGPTLSKIGKILYICPLPPTVDPEKREAIKEAIRKNAEIYGSAMGVDFIFNEIPYGIRFDITAKNPQGQMTMGGGSLQRITIQLEAASQGILTTITMYLAGGMGFLESIALDRDSDMEKIWRSQVERINGVPPGKCRLL